MTERDGPPSDDLPTGLGPFRAMAGSLFEAGARLRARAYDAGLFPAERVGRPVISVGNLIVGGAGKTPFVRLLVEQLTEWGYTPGILSRGYRRKSTGQVVVSSGERPLVGPEQSGDEPMLLAHETSAIVVVDAHRVRGAHKAIELGADVLVLDDGFSHRRLARDLDIVMLDAQRPFANGLLLPEGPLREPPVALKRADLLVLNRTLESDLSLREALPNRPSIEVVVEPVALTAGLGGPRTPIMSLLGTPVGILSAIARPHRFRRTMEGLGARVVHEVTHPDHAELSEADVERFITEARIKGAKRFITTEKDAARGATMGPLEVLAIRLRVEEGEDILHTMLKEILSSQ